MAAGLDFALAVTSFIVMLGPLILIHELGHFIAARLNNITVEEFGIGFPPRMITLFSQGGTRFTLNWIPLGGFMRPAGEDNPDVPGGLAAASRRARFAVLAAGPGANFIAAFVLLFVMFLIGAPDTKPGALVVEVVPGTPAEHAGLEVGDIVVEANGRSIANRDDLISLIHANLGVEVDLTVAREGTTVNITLIPRETYPSDQGPTGIRVSPVLEVRKYGPFEAVQRTATEIVTLLKTFVELPIAVIRNQIPARFLRPVSVVGISQLGGQQIAASMDQNAAWPIIQWTAFVSLALGITNLLPIPALDGGRILFVVLEFVRGKRMDPRREMAIHFVGFAVLLAAMLIFVYLDIVDPLVQ